MSKKDIEYIALATVEIKEITGYDAIQWRDAFECMLNKVYLDINTDEPIEVNYKISCDDNDFYLEVYDTKGEMIDKGSICEVEFFTEK